MRIINIVDRIDYVNYGIWNAALCTARVLKDKYGIESHVWFPKIDKIPSEDALNTSCYEALEDLSLGNVDKLIEKHRLSPNDTIIVTHGVWRYPTKWGRAFADRGYKWVYTPHGMLEPWGMKSKALKKLVYFHLFEKRMAAKATCVRAVSSIEQQNLRKKLALDNIVLIPNGSDRVEAKGDKFRGDKINFLFLGRLNFKKSVSELAQAWKKSKFGYNSKFQLSICGPDDGELGNLSWILADAKLNILLRAESVSGADKEKVFEDSDFFLLPSKSEGFPTSVVEAGMHGLLPVISDGCNFPELFAQGLGIKIGDSEGEILDVLNQIYEKVSSEEKIDDLRAESLKTKQFFIDNYTIESIADKQCQLYQKI